MTNFFVFLDEYKKQGNTVIFISHKLKEYLRICDDITVLRDAQYIGCLPREEIDEDQIVKMMVGRDLSKFFTLKKALSDDVLIMELNDFRVGAVKADFSIKQGEIFALAGLVGCGRSELGLFPRPKLIQNRYYQF